MTRLNTDNVAAFLYVEAPAADSPPPRTDPEAKPFDSFLQRTGRSPDTGAEDAARGRESGPPPSEEGDPIDAPSNSTEQDIAKPAEADSESEEDLATPDSDQPEATDAQSDDETDEQVDAASGERSDGNTDGKEQAAVVVDVTAIGSTGGGQETGDDADSAAEEAQSRDSRAGVENRHEDREGESGAVRAATPTSTSGGSEPAVQAPVEPEVSTEEEKPTDVRRQGEEEKPVGPSEGTPKRSAAGDDTVTESKDKPEEKPSSESRSDNPFDPTASQQGRRASSEESGRRTKRQGPTRAAAEDRDTPAADGSFRTVAKALAGEETATVQGEVNADEIAAAPEEAKSEAQEKTVKPASNADLKATSATPPKGWSPEGLRSTAAASAPDGTQADRVRFVQRVARAFEALGDGNGSVRLRLRPPELGGLRLEVSIRNGMMTAHIETETSAARTLLLDNLPALRERLAQQDIKVDSFDVDLADRSPDGSPQRPDDDRQPRERRDGNETQAAENQDGDTAGGGSVGAIARTGEGARLDVVI